MARPTEPLNILIYTAVPADADRLVDLLRQGGFEPRVTRAGASTPALVTIDPHLDMILAELPGPAPVAMAEGFQPASCSSIAESHPKTALTAEEPGLPWGWALEALAMQRQSGLRIPLIVIADPAMEAQAAECLNAGASDYLCKDRLARLAAAVRRALLPHPNQYHLEDQVRYQMLFEHAHDIFLFVRLNDGLILEANKAAEKAYGYTRTELLGMNIAALRAPETRPLLEAHLNQVRSTANRHEGVVFETCHMRKDGSRIPVEVSSLGVSIDGEKVSLSIIHDITHRKDAELALERRMIELEALNEVAQAGAEATSLDELVRRVVQTVRQRLFPDEFGVAFLNDAEDTLSYHPSSYRLLNGEERTISIHQGIMGAVARSGRPMRVGDVRQCPDYYRASPSVLSEVCVPLVIDGRVVGVLNAESSVLGYFNAADEQLLVAIAGAMATALEKIRLLETERSRLKELEALAELSRQQLERLTALRSIDQSILTAPDLEQTLKVLLEKFTNLLRLDAVQILLYDARHQVLLLAAEKGMPSKPLFPKKVAFENTHAGQVALQRQVEFIPDLSQVEDAMTRRLKTIGASFASYLALPMVAKGQVKGVVEIFQHARLEPAADWMNFLQALTDQAAIAIDSALLFKEQKQTNERLREAYEDTIDGWSRVLDMRDRETEGHSRRVTELTMRLARRLGVTSEQLAHIRRGAQLHDIGKMGIRDNILLKPGPLTAEEWEIMKLHPLYALDFLYPIEYLASALEIPYCHHEKWDGTGYPQGLSGEKIPLAARIFTVVDVWDALTSQRPYRPAWPKEQAVAYILDQSGHSFDPQVVEHFMAILEEEGIGDSGLEIGKQERSEPSIREAEGRELAIDETEICQPWILNRPVSAASSHPQPLPPESPIINHQSPSNPSHD